MLLRLLTSIEPYRAIEEPRHERFDTYNESGRKNGGNRKVLPD